MGDMVFPANFEAGFICSCYSSQVNEPSFYFSYRDKGKGF